jgi:hypothetical protein
MLSVLKYNVVAGFAFGAENSFNTCLAILYGAVLVVAGFAAGEYLAANATVVFRSPRNVPVPA